MGDLLIRGMELPSIGYREIRIYPDGRVIEEDECGWDEVVGTAEQVQSHGKLIDADSKTFPTLHRNPSNDYMKGWNACLRSVQQQPTIIPASEERT